MIVGGYSLHLYCDGPCDVADNRGMTRVDEIEGTSEADCMKQARQRGWTFNRDKTKCFCKQCKR